MNLSLLVLIQLLCVCLRFKILGTGLPVTLGKLNHAHHQPIYVHSNYYSLLVTLHNCSVLYFCSNAAVGTERKQPWQLLLWLQATVGSRLSEQLGTIKISTLYG